MANLIDNFFILKFFSSKPKTGFDPRRAGTTRSLSSEPGLKASFGRKKRVKTRFWKK